MTSINKRKGKEETLLQKALSTHTLNKKKIYSKEEVDLAIAWAEGRVKMSQIGRVTGFSGNTILTWIVYRMRQAWQQQSSVTHPKHRKGKGKV